MPPLYVLPTYSIFNRFKKAEKLFTFYDDGLHGIIRDAVIVSAGYALVPYPQSVMTEKTERLNGFIDKVLREYADSREAILAEHSCYPDNSMLIEIIVDQIEDAVEEMMHGIFRYMPQDISPVDYRWIGNDLAISINFFQ